MEIHRLTPSNAAAYRQLMLDAYVLHPEAFTSSAAERAELPLSWWENRVSAEADAKAAVFGAFVDGALTGVTGISFEVREKIRHKAMLFGMYVLQGFRHCGFARALVEAVLDCARARSYVQLAQLTVVEGNVAARRLYETCGFSAFGLEPYAMAIGGEYAAKVHMWRAIRELGAVD
jgi:GNAT superfamily N-acetyltransferase